MIQLSETLQPLINLMKDEVVGYDMAYIDATRLQVLHEPGRHPETKSHAYCIRGGLPEKAYPLLKNKPLVMGRKNFLCACTQAGADSLGVHFSLIVSAKHHGLNPAAYYEALFNRLLWAISL